MLTHVPKLKSCQGDRPRMRSESSRGSSRSLAPLQRSGAVPALPNPHAERSMGMVDDGHVKMVIIWFSYG